MLLMCGCVAVLLCQLVAGVIRAGVWVSDDGECEGACLRRRGCNARKNAGGFADVNTRGVRTWEMGLASSGYYSSTKSSAAAKWRQTIH